MSFQHASSDRDQSKSLVVLAPKAPEFLTSNRVGIEAMQNSYHFCCQSQSLSISNQAIKEFAREACIQSRLICKTMLQVQ